MIYIKPTLSYKNSLQKRKYQMLKDSFTWATDTKRLLKIIYEWLRKECPQKICMGSSISIGQQFPFDGCTYILRAVWIL
jgi:hypothetical protein